MKAPLPARLLPAVAATAAAAFAAVPAPSASAAVIVRDDFTVGQGDNTLNAPINGTLTEGSNPVRWQVNGQAIRFNNPGNPTGGGRGKVDNTNAGTSSIAQFGYTGFTAPSSGITTLRANAAVVNLNRIRFGFSEDTSNFITNDADAFYAEVLFGGQTSFVASDDNTDRVLATGDAIPGTNNQVELAIELTYDSGAGTVSGSVTGPTGAATLAPTLLGFTPNFNNVQFDFVNLNGTGGNFPYFDAVELSSQPVPEPATLALSLAGLTLIAGRRRRA